MKRITLVLLILFLGSGVFLIYKNLTMPRISEKFQLTEFKTEKSEILVGVISDTHLPTRAQILPKEIKEVFSGVDLIIHAGDWVSLDVKEELEKIAQVFGVQGNTDFPEIRERLPKAVELKIYDWKIGIIHSPNSWLGAFVDFTKRGGQELAKKEEFDILIFGHTHQSYLKEFTPKEGKKLLLINPGSPTDPLFTKPSLIILRLTKNSYEAKIINF